MHPRHRWASPGYWASLGKAGGAEAVLASTGTASAGEGTLVVVLVPLPDVPVLVVVELAPVLFRPRGQNLGAGRAFAGVQIAHRQAVAVFLVRHAVIVEAYAGLRGLFRAAVAAALALRDAVPDVHVRHWPDTD